MFPAFMAETSRNVEHLRITGTEINYLGSLRWVHDAYQCRVFLMLHIATSFHHIPLGLYGLDHEQRSAGNH